MSTPDHRAAYRAALDEIAAVIAKHADVMAPHVDADNDVIERGDGEVMPGAILTRFVLIASWQSINAADEWDRPLGAFGVDRYPLEMEQSDAVGLLVRATDSERCIVAGMG